MTQHHVNFMLSGIKISQQSLGIDGAARSRDRNHDSHARPKEQTRIGIAIWPGEKRRASFFAARHRACLEPVSPHNTDVPDGLTHLRIALLAGVLGSLVGCRTLPEPSASLPTTTVAEEIIIAPAAPLTAPLLPSPQKTERGPSGTNAWISLAQWCRDLGLAAPIQIATNPTASFLVQGASRALTLRIGRRTVVCEGLECWLGFTPQFLNGIPQIHALDARKNLEPLVKTFSRSLAPRQTIVIDAGHGGRDPGTQSSRNQSEKEYTLDWARRLQALLLVRGWNVTLTRTNDTEVLLADRVLQAEQAQADLFISLHFNSGPPKAQLSGIETYCLTPPGMPSTLVRGEEDDLNWWPNNAFDAKNLQLSWRLHAALLRRTGAVDRGVRRARFMTVLRGQNRPAVLVEGGYLSNAAEAKKIATAAYRQTLAEAVAEALD